MSPPARTDQIVTYERSVPSQRREAICSSSARAIRSSSAAGQALIAAGYDPRLSIAPDAYRARDRTRTGTR
jgi:hypothetical protein